MKTLVIIWFVSIWLLLIFYVGTQLAEPSSAFRPSMNGIPNEWDYAGMIAGSFAASVSILVTGGYFAWKKITSGLNSSSL